MENYTPSATTTSTMGDTPAEADNVRVTGLAALLPPSCAFEELPGDGEIYNLCVETREQILAVMKRADDRLLLLIEPEEGATDTMAMDRLGRRLLELAPLGDDVLVVVQAGAVARDPDGDGSFRVNGGLKAARELLLHLNRLGVPTAVDFADTVTPQFFADLVSCASVRADSPRHPRNSAQFCAPVSDAQSSRRRSPRSPRRCASSSPASRCPSACVRPSTTPPPPSARTRSRRRPTTS